MLSLAQYQPAGLPADGIVFLNFWATWCEPCVRELPSMISLKRRMRGRPFAMLAVSYDSDWPAIAKFFDSVFGGTPQELDVVRDPATADQSTLRWAFGTEKIPETYILRDGRVLARFVNARDWASPEIIEYFERLTDPM
jgi:thiol-disulfide isomerase/thioredoxin